MNGYQHVFTGQEVSFLTFDTTNEIQSQQKEIRGSKDVIRKNTLSTNLNRSANEKMQKKEQYIFFVPGPEARES